MKEMNEKKMNKKNSLHTICICMCIGINKDNAIRNPNILSMHLREQQKIKTNQTKPTRESLNEMQATLFYKLHRTVAIYPKAECVLTTDAKNPTHYHRIFGSTVCTRFTT